MEQDCRFSEGGGGGGGGEAVAAVVDRPVRHLLLSWSNVIYDCSNHFLCFHLA